jgi:chaperonin GroEL (HSP60 family)
MQPCFHRRRTLTKLRAKHAETPNSTFGINGNSGDIVDMQQLGVWEPYAVKVTCAAEPYNLISACVS